MLQSIKNILFSTRLTAILLLVFAVAIGAATFIENDYGTPASKALVFNTRWFELVIVLLGINLVGNIFKYKMFRKEKLAVLTFHISLIIIIIGAGITRYVSFEGSMHIREGDTSSTIVSDDTYFRFKVDDKKTQYTGEQKLYLNPRYNKPFEFDFEFEGKPVHMEYKGFIPNSIDTVIEVSGGKKIIEIVTVGQGGRLSRFVESGQTKFFGNLPIAFNNNDVKEAIQIITTDSGVFVLSPYDLEYLSMDDQSTGLLAKDTLHPFKNRRLYSVGQVQLVYKTIHENAKIEKIEASKDNKNGEDALIVDVTCAGEQKEVTLFGGKGYVSNNTIFQMSGLNISLAYGSKEYFTPFGVRLNDFKLERYPGSNSPSSFESEVTLVDNRSGGVEFDQRIYMNNVLDYDGYRMFQSSYDQDEGGTILSVNHDFWGTLITYIGYFLMIVGMVLTLVSKKSRFNNLRNSIKKMRKGAGLIAVISLLSFNVNAQDNHEGHNHGEGDHQKAEIKEVVIDVNHAEEFSKLLVQDNGGRIKPLHTMSSEVVRKVTGKEDFNNQNASQVFLGMMYNSPQWRETKMIKVKNPELEEKLGAVNHYVSFIDLFDDQFNYKLAKFVEEANRKKPAEQDKFDKEVLKVDERANICLLVFQGSLLKIFPKFKEENNTWYTSMDYKQFSSHDSIFVKAMIPMYFGAISQSIKNNDWALADTTLKHLVDYQNKFGADVIPPQSKIDAEITYNKLHIFKKLFMYYALVGLFMLFFLFADIISPKKWKKLIIKICSYVLMVLFLVHAGGLAMRWYISGHAPWSNGYESMIYIAFITVLAGFVFSKSSKMTIAATAVLASLTLMVAHLNFMDPEITPLVPVLKSYWLMIHVAVITGSYGFLGLGAVLALMNLLLMIFRTKNNNDRIGRTLKELTYINELTLTVGLFMAAIGTFLGGVWANESWGRYWGWDPKETWALVIVLFYAMLLHLRFIPKANGKYLFNTLALFGFSTVIMTYFGVNYYLSGLHSYAKGDPVPIPSYVPITVGVAVVIALIAYFRNKKFSIK
ncbi:MAG: cytochrome c biogenesis protein CcsA [Vicingaceae bacterium]|nr:cytochrome c biogenesis protein CcsA [Vicingaceae bacterium]